MAEAMMMKSLFATERTTRNASIDAKTIPKASSTGR